MVDELSYKVEDILFTIEFNIKQTLRQLLWTVVCENEKNFGILLDEIIHEIFRTSQRSPIYGDDDGFFSDGGDYPTWGSSKKTEEKLLKLGEILNKYRIEQTWNVGRALKSKKKGD